MNTAIAANSAEPTASFSAPATRETTSQAARTPSSVPAPMRDEVSLQPLGAALQSLVGLPENWDSYGAGAPTQFSLERAWFFASKLVDDGLPIPDVFPTRRGGVQLEWHSDAISLEWEIDPLGATGVFIFDDYRTGEKIDGDLPADLRLLNVALHRVPAA